jgi:WD40 repeat protein
MHVGFDTSATRIIAEAQVAGIGGRGLLWNTATDEQLHLWEATGPKDDLLQSAFDAAESRLITNRRSSGVQVWDCTTGRQLSHLPDATCMALGSAGDYLVTGEKDCSVTLRPIRCIEP